MRCRICGASISSPSVSAREVMYRFDGLFNYFRCDSCSCFQIENYPAEIGDFYPPEYHSVSGIAGLVKVIKSWLLSRRNDFELGSLNIIGLLTSIYLPSLGLKYLRPYILRKDTRILDVGCADGQMLLSLSRLGYTKLTGIDPFFENNNTHRGCIFIKDYFHSIKAKYDLITFFHSLEHMPNQNETFRKISESLAKGGVCIVAVPIFPSYVWDCYGPNWVQLDAPRHFYLHSRNSLSILAKNNGLNIKDIFYNSYEFQFLGSQVIANGGHTKNFRQSFYVIIFFPLFLFIKLYYRIFSIYLNKIQKGDQAVIVLVKN